MTNIDVCNRALDIVGQGGMITSFDQRTPEAEMCKRHFMPTYQTALDAYNWSFARRDEIIDKDNLLSDVCVLPYAYAYELPEDVMRVLYLTEMDAPATIETLSNRHAIQFNFRNYDGKKVLATNTAEGKDVEIDCDMVVMAVGSKKNTLDVEGVTTPLTYVGDCSGDRTADIAAAIRSGYNAANEI